MLTAWLLISGLGLGLSHDRPNPYLQGDRDPQAAAVARAQGLSDRNQGNWSAALDALHHAVDLDPTAPQSWVILGWTYHLAGQDEPAEAVLTQARQLDPWNETVLNSLGIVYLVQGKLGAAVQTHGQAVVQNPANEIAHYNLSLAFNRLGLQDWAILTAEQASRLEPSNPHPLVALALALAQRDGSDVAQATFEEVLALDPRYGDRSFLEHLTAAGFSSDQIQHLETQVYNCFFNSSSSKSVSNC